MSWLTCAQEEASLDDALLDCEGHDQVVAVLSAAGYECRDITFKNGETVIVAQKGASMFVVDPDFPELTDINDWIVKIDDWKLQGYMDQTEDFNNEFWHGKEFVKRLYHGTWINDADVVMKEGLKPHNETRGISNRSTGSAVFTTTYNQASDEGYRYGGAVIEINTEGMLADGYTPEVSREYPIDTENTRDALAYQLGHKEFYNHRKDELTNDGIHDTTIIVYGEIPAKYLKRLL